MDVWQERFMAVMRDELNAILDKKLQSVTNGTSVLEVKEAWQSQGDSWNFSGAFETLLDRRFEGLLASVESRLDKLSPALQKRKGIPRRPENAQPGTLPPHRKLESELSSADATDSATIVPGLHQKWQSDDTAYHALAKSQAAELHKKRSTVLSETPPPPPSCFTRVQEMLRSSYFELFWFLMILANSALLGCQVEMQALGVDGDHDFHTANLVFCILFLVELLLRFFADGQCCHFFFKSPSRGWHWFDTIVVTVTILELFLSALLGGVAGNVRAVRLLRMMRILRAARILKLIQYVAPLRRLLQSILGTFKSLCWAMLLLFMIMFVFSIIFTDAVSSAIRESPELSGAHFGDLNLSMLSLFWSITGGTDCWPLMQDLIAVSWVWCYVYIFYMCVGLFAVLNVMTAIFCQSAAESAGKDTELVVSSWKENRENLAKDFERLFHNLADQRDGVIDLKALESDLKDTWIRDFFAALDVEPTDAFTLFKLLDISGDGVIDGAEFVEGCMKLRGGAKAIDVTATKWEVMRLQRQFRDLTKAVTAVLSALKEPSEVNQEALEPDHSPGPGEQSAALEVPHEHGRIDRFHL